METLKILLLCVGSSILYGVLHDQVTARVCVEYFTIFHPHVIDSESPTRLALVWGITATWWAGLMVGIPAALTCRMGPMPRFTAAQLWRPIRVLLVVMGAASLVAGFVGYFASRAGWVWLIEPLRSQIPVEKHPAFLFDLWAHNAAYAFGFLGGLTVCAWVWYQRRRMAGVTESHDRSISHSE